jgi:hypothetical protein
MSTVRQLTIFDVHQADEEPPGEHDEEINNRLVQLREDREDREEAYSYSSKGMNPRRRTRSIPQTRNRREPALVRGSIARSGADSKCAGRVSR